MDFINNYAVKVTTLSKEFVGIWPSASLAAKALKIKHTGNLRECLIGNRNHANGYVWEYTTLKVDVCEGEEWKPVVGFEELYAVSNIGRVASLQYHGKKSFSLMSLTNNGRNYLMVKIRNSKTGYVKSLPVHRLVAEAFIPNPENKPQVDHIDTNSLNNHVSNLRWVTNLENQRNPLTLSRISKHMKSMNSCKIGVTISAKNRSIKVKHTTRNSFMLYNSAQEAGIATGHTTSLILRWARANKHGWSLV